ncbi:MAG: hypothetical protein Q4G19_05285 [Clostridia bacterium]|nr:hypothetical protein [Clostridia bacterium]
MGLFTGKKHMTHAEKTRYAYESYREEIVGRLFPGGAAQAGDIITDLSAILGIDPESCSADRYEEILNLYSETYVGRVMNDKAKTDIVSDLHRRYRKLCGGHEEAVCAYALNLIEPPAEADEGPAAADADVWDHIAAAFAAEDGEPYAAEEEPDGPETDGAEADAEETVRRAYKKTVKKYGLDGDAEHPALRMMRENRKDFVKRIMADFGENGAAAAETAYYAALYAAAQTVKEEDVFAAADRGVYTFLERNMLLDMNEIGDEARRLVKDKKDKISKPLGDFLEKAEIPETWNTMTDTEQKLVLRCACMLGARQGIRA